MTYKKEKFDKRKYDIEYRKNNYKEFRSYLTIKEFDYLNKKLDELKISKSQFLRNAIKELEKK